MPILILGLIAAATTAGYNVSRRYNGRERFFLEAGLLCDRLSAEIKFSRSTLAAAFAFAAADCKSHLRILAEKYSALLGEYADTSEVVLRGELPAGYLKPAEFDIMLRFFGSLGRADAETELKTIAGYKAAIEGFHAEAAAEKKKYGGLYTKLGFLAGVVISILII